MSPSRRDFLKTSAGLSAGLMVGGGLIGCQSTDTSSTILIGITSRPRTLDPRQATDALSSRINRLLYRQLIDFDHQSQPIADLASWQQLSPTHYRFTLIDQSLFHHGKTLNAADVAATYLSVLDAQTGSPHRGALKNIKHIMVINEQIVDFVLDAPDALFVGRLNLGIMPKDLIDQQHDFSQQPIGSGQAKFEQLNEQQLTLRRPDGMALRFVVVKDPLVRVLKLKKGELDCVQNDLSPELVGYCDQHPNLSVSWQKGSSFSYIGFNLDDPLIAQPALRHAIAHAIDRQQIIDALFHGQARLAGGLLVPEHWAGNPALQGVAFDLERANALMRQVTRDDDQTKPLTLSFKTSSDPTRIRIATLYQAQLKKIGINLQVQSYDWGTFYSDIVKGRFQMFSLAWVGIKSPDIFQYVFASNAIPPNGANRGRYRDQRADELIEQAGQAISIQQQAALYRELQAHLQATLPVMPLWYENQYAVTRKNLSGYQLFADGRLDSLLSVQKNV